LLTAPGAHPLTGLRSPPALLLLLLPSPLLLASLLLQG
jgi:hypothetical protein